MKKIKKVLGPYERPDKRKHMVIHYEDGSKGTKSYPKYLMEQKLGRELESDETVDHINRDCTDDRIENLQILKRSEHCSLDVKRRKSQDFVCPWCDNSFTLSGRKLNNATQNREKGHTGPFCSRSCSGKHSRQVQLGNKNPAKKAKIVPEHYYKDKTEP